MSTKSSQIVKKWKLFGRIVWFFAHKLLKGDRNGDELFMAGIGRNFHFLLDFAGKWRCAGRSGHRRRRSRDLFGGFHCRWDLPLDGGGEADGTRRGNGIAVTITPTVSASPVSAKAIAGMYVIAMISDNVKTAIPFLIFITNSPQLEPNLDLPLYNRFLLLIPILT
jgi:hypothetical protein